MTDLKKRYQSDIAAWTKPQTEVLRAAGRGGSNRPLDWENLAEEIEDLGYRSAWRFVARHADNTAFGEAGVFVLDRPEEQMGS